MNHFPLQDGQRYCESVSLASIAEQFGSPTYVYSRAALEAQFQSYVDGLEGQEHLICYAVKANSNLAVLNVLARMGAGFDIVSIGELERVILAGGTPNKIVYSGVGKQSIEIARALEVGVHCFNVESVPELQRINRVASEMDKVANVSLRVNPDVDANTHPYISTGLKENKFGINIDIALQAYQEAQQLSHLNIVGIDCHIGSQLTETSPFLDALERVLALVDQLADIGITLQHLDLGGGLGVTYQDEQPPTPAAYAAEIKQRLQGRDLKLILEPGRSIAANAGILLTQVEFLKCTEHKNFAIVDAAMNDMIRPSLYQAWLDVQPVTPSADNPVNDYDIVGPVCETGDFLAKDRKLALAEGDLLMVASCGAYGFCMSSNYNSRGRAAEVMVDKDRVYLVRQRETLADLVRGESLLPG